MSIEGLLIGAALVTLVGVIVLLPLLRRPQPRPPTDLLLEKQRERLLIYYERALRNLRDLDEDFALGKIEPEVYAADRELWAERGVQALKALDTLAERSMLAQTEADDTAVDRAIDAAIETAVRRAREAEIRSRQQVTE